MNHYPINPVVISAVLKYAKHMLNDPHYKNSQTYAVAYIFRFYELWFLRAFL